MSAHPAKPKLATVFDIVAAAVVDPEECGEHCECPCHDYAIDDPGEHIATCAWADPTFPDYLMEPL